MHAVHIPGTHNTIADDLSHNRLPKLHQFTASASPSPSQVSSSFSWVNHLQTGPPGTAPACGEISARRTCTLHSEGLPSRPKPIHCVHYRHAPPPATSHSREYYLICCLPGSPAPLTFHHRVLPVCSEALPLDARPFLLAPSLLSPHLKLLLWGIKRVNARISSRTRLPITAMILRRIKSLQQDHLIWAACCVGFFGFLRTAEFLTPDDTAFSEDNHLSLRDVTFNGSKTPWCFHINIKVSITDQDRRGTTIILGRTNADLCPVEALLDYLNLCGNHPGPLFQSPTGLAIHRRYYVEQVQQALSAAGLPSDLFNGHSFRIAQ